MKVKVLGDERYQRGARVAQGVDEEGKETGSHSLHWSLIRYFLFLFLKMPQGSAILKLEECFDTQFIASFKGSVQ